MFVDRQKRAAFLLITSVLGALMFGLFYVLFLRVEAPSGPVCRELPVSARVPDIAMDDARGVAYLAYLDSAQRSDGKSGRGTVMLMDLNVANPQVRGALVTEPQDFQPATLSLYAPPGGTRRLFVVERGKDAPGVVRIFEQSSSGAFELVKTVKDAMLTSPVAIAAAGTDRFYVRNGVIGSGAFARLRGLFHKSNVVYYDGMKMTVAPADAGARVRTARKDDPAEYASLKANKRLQVFERDEQSDQLLLCAGAK